MIPLFMGFGGPEILFIVFVVMLLFGGKKIPELMKGLGKGIKSFKDGVNGLEDKNVPIETITDNQSGDLPEKLLEE